jgi:hypothetical protein
MESENLKPMKTLLKHSVVYKLIGVFKKFLSIFRIIILFFKESMNKKNNKTSLFFVVNVATTTHMKYLKTNGIA